MAMQAGRFTGRRAVVTGASAGIGRATALRFATEGARVGLVARRREPLDALAAEIARGEQFDLVHAHDWMTFPAGLAVAVPAVLGYNWLLRRNKVIQDNVRNFASDLHAYLVSGARVTGP